MAERLPAISGGRIRAISSEFEASSIAPPSAPIGCSANVRMNATQNIVPNTDCVAASPAWVAFACNTSDTLGRNNDMGSSSGKNDFSSADPGQ
ncbi:hypothetical protein [Edaphosphingomonas haloaromaticamans]|uniref:hypothetical protein n=1 Tax=Edaphosphingomonas haloaromaticamans TaxID=653954 RepID=UPI001C2F7110|nr:hypothetical protein [Sphingomonas haloaromaticamans]